MGECVQPINTSYGPGGGPDSACFPGYYWTMPLGNPSSYSGFQAPCIYYNSAGTDTITLYEVDAQGNVNYSNFVTCIVTVVNATPPAFTYMPLSPCMDDSVQFTYTGYNTEPYIF
ncbi:MAG: hypothetical protein Fur0041_17440 [Bacteroidia bacterium]